MSCLVFFNPNLLNHPDNYIKADAIVTPTHIVPEWYFLPFYAILRSIPDKFGGVVCMFASILILFILPIFPGFIIKSSKFDVMSQFFFWLFIFDVILLGWLGSQVVEYPYVIIGQGATIFYFLYLILVIPILSWIDNIMLKQK